MTFPGAFTPSCTLHCSHARGTPVELFDCALGIFGSQLKEYLASSEGDHLDFRPIRVLYGQSAQQIVTIFGLQ